MATDDKREKTSRKTNARRDKKIEKKRAKISERAASSRADGFDVPEAETTARASSANKTAKAAKKKVSAKDKKIEKRRAANRAKRSESARKTELKSERKAAAKSSRKSGSKSRKSESRREYRVPKDPAQEPFVIVGERSEGYDGNAITASNRNRLAAGLAVLLVLICALIFRMGYWQIYKSDELKLMATDMQKVDTEIQPVRGAIYDSQMSTLAESVTEYELYAYTQTMYKAEEISQAEKQKTVMALSKCTGKDPAEITKLLEDEENLVVPVTDSVAADGDVVGRGVGDLDPVREGTGLVRECAAVGRHDLRNAQAPVAGADLLRIDLRAGHIWRRYRIRSGREEDERNEQRTEGKEKDKRIFFRLLTPQALTDGLLRKAGMGSTFLHGFVLSQDTDRVL